MVRRATFGNTVFHYNIFFIIIYIRDLLHVILKSSYLGGHGMVLHLRRISCSFSNPWHFFSGTGCCVCSLIHTCLSICTPYVTYRNNLYPQIATQLVIKQTNYQLILVYLHRMICCTRCDQSFSK